MAQKIIAATIKIKVDGKEDIVISAKTLEDLRKQIKALEKDTDGLDVGTKAFTQQQQAVTQLNTLYRQLKKDGTDALTKIGDAQQKINQPGASALGYYRQLQAELAKLTNEYKDLSEAELKSNIGITLGKRVNDVNSKLKELDAGLGNYQREVGNYGKAFQGLTGVVSKGLGIFGAVFGALTGASEIVNTTREFERLSGTLTQQFNGDALKAASAFNQIKEAASSTPFSVSELTEAFIVLGRDGTKPSIEQINRFADLAASQGKSITQLAEAIADAQVGQYERLLQFGVDVNQQGKETVVTFQGVAKTFEKGSPAIAEYIETLGALPGIAGAASAVSKTLDGSLSNLGDNIDRLFAAMGAGGGVLKSFVDGINDVLGSIVGIIEQPLSEKLRSQQVEFNALTGILQNGNEKLEVKKIAQGELLRQFPDYIKFIGDQKNGEIDLAKTIEFGNNLFRQRIFLQANEEQRIQFEKERLAAAQGIVTAEKALTDARARYNKERTVTQQLEDLFKPSAGEALLAYQKQRKALDDITTSQAKFAEDNKALRIAFFGNEEAANAAEKSYSEFLKTSEATNKETKSGTEATKAAAGSLKALQDRVQKLQDLRDNASPGNAFGFDKELQKAEKRLKDFQDALERARKGATPQSVINELVGTVDGQPTQIELSAGISELEKAQSIERTTQTVAEIAAGVESRVQAVEFSVTPSDIGFDDADIQITGLLDTIQKLRNELAGTTGDQAELIYAQLKDAEDKLNDVTDERKKSAEQLFEIQQKDGEYEQKQHEERLKRIEEEREKRRQTVEEVASSVASLSGKIFEIQQQNISNRLDSEKKALELEYDAKIEAAQGNAVQQELLQKEFQAKQLEADKEAARERKKIAIKEAAIEYALALIKSGGNLLKAGLATAEFIASLALINAQEFAKGGIVRRVTGVVTGPANAPQTKAGDNILAYLKAREMVLNEQQQAYIAAIAGKDIFRRAGVPGASAQVPAYAAASIAQRGIPSHFADGGVVAGAGGTSVSVNINMSDEQISRMAYEIAVNTASATGQAVGTAVETAAAAARREDELRRRING